MITGFYVSQYIRKKFVFQELILRKALADKFFG